MVTVDTGSSYVWSSVGFSVNAMERILTFFCGLFVGLLKLQVPQLSEMVCFQSHDAIGNEDTCVTISWVYHESIQDNSKLPSLRNGVEALDWVRDALDTEV